MVVPNVQTASIIFEKPQDKGTTKIYNYIHLIGEIRKGLPAVGNGMSIELV